LTGRLVLVATPIGNLGDLSPRAVQALAAADVVACEDTRRTGRLLQHAGVRAPRLLVVNEHTESTATTEILELVRAGKVVALVTDAGTPGISDPGERVVAALAADSLLVEAVPGPAAVVMALTMSGLPSARFVMEGFLPRKGRERSTRLAELALERRTIVLYEAPHRLARTLTDLAEILGGDRRVAVARELTKLHEELWRGTLSDAVQRSAEVEARGEYVLVVEGAAPVELDPDQVVVALTARLAAGASRRDAVDQVAQQFGASRRLVYDLALGLVDPADGLPNTN
jgi:16S rRNA (cytidine1402-2'-O)-methyltransferase